jgi:hypothetical protein
MDTKSFVAFAEVVSVVIGTMGLAMGLEWVTLNVLLRLMPSRSLRQSAAGQTRQSL